MSFKADLTSPEPFEHERRSKHLSRVDTSVASTEHTCATTAGEGSGRSEPHTTAHFYSS